jgi:hypothetical protein
VRLLLSTLPLLQIRQVRRIFASIGSAGKLAQLARSTGVPILLSGLGLALLEMQERKLGVGIEFDQPSPRSWRISFPPNDWNSRNPEAKRFTSATRSTTK